VQLGEHCITKFHAFTDRLGVTDSINLYVEKQDRTKLTGPSYFKSCQAVGYPKFDLPMFDIRVKSLVV